MKKIVAITICILIFLQFCCPIVHAIDSPDYVEDIGAGHKWMLGFDLTTKYELIVEFEVVEGGNKDIDIYIVDSENYDKLIQGHDFIYIKYYQRVISGTIFFTPEEDGKYWFIFDNTFSTFTTKKIEVKYDYSYIDEPDDGDNGDDSNSNGTQLPEDTTDSNMIIVLIIGGFVLIIVIVIIIAIIKKSKKPSPQQQVVIIQKGEKINKELRFCSNCGREIKKDVTYCEFCGAAQ